MILIRWLRCLLALGLALGAGGACAQAEPTRLRVVGGLAGVNQYTRHEEPFWTRELPRLSGGRYSAEIVPFDRAGIRAEELLSLIELGVVPFGTVLLSRESTRHLEIGGLDLAGLNPDMDTLRRTVAAARPWLARTLRERRGVELLAVYVYPAQVVFCNKPLSGLAGLAGRRVRTSSPSQSDLVQALGGTPVPTTFADIVPQMKTGNIECAITGTMSGNTIGLHELSTHVHALAINWGLSIAAANAAAWAALPEDLRALLRRELPVLEEAIWTESDRETASGLACNTGAPGCTEGRKGRMVLVRASAEDEKLRRDIFTRVVLPRWLQRCGAGCAATWNEHLAAPTGVRAGVAR